jgi:hypothetical protein
MPIHSWPSYRGYFAFVISGLALFCSLLATAHAQSGSLGPADGQVSIHQVSVAFIGSASVGGGTLRYRGRTYRFKVGGLGVGGMGASRLDAGGNVYGLRQLTDFEGAYLQVRSGFAAGDVGRGTMRLRNAHGVVMRLRAQRRGLALTLGADGMIVTLAR